MTPAGIEPVIFRFVAQHLNHCATAVPAPHNVEKHTNADVTMQWSTAVYELREGCCL